jgi:hypothetical protein
MLHLIVASRSMRARQIKQLTSKTSDGNPRAQAKLAEKLEAVGQPFILQVHVNPGKRGRYDLHILCIDGWHEGRRELISEDDKIIPEKPWLACTIIKLTSRERGLYDEEAIPFIFITHHALSRLAQRCGARTPQDLLAAACNICFGYLKGCVERKGSRWVKAELSPQISVERRSLCLRRAQTLRRQGRRGSRRDHR